MKKILLTFITLLIIISSLFFGYKYLYKTKNDNQAVPPIKMDNVKPDIDNEDTKYEDNNPIIVGLYKYYRRGKDRELITEYINNWAYHQDISSFEVLYTNEETTNSNLLQDNFNEYFNTHENTNNYRIGFIISFMTTNNEINKTIISPKDTEEFFDYLEIYLYDDYHIQKGVWYSHTTEEEFNEETLLTSIKLTAGKNIDEITSDIKLTVFTYDYDDFDEFNNYRGNSKYTIVVKKSN